MIRSEKKARLALDDRLGHYIDMMLNTKVLDEIGHASFLHYISTTLGACIGSIEFAYDLGVISFDEYLWLERAVRSIHTYLVESI